MIFFVSLCPFKNYNIVNAIVLNSDSGDKADQESNLENSLESNEEHEPGRVSEIEESYSVAEVIPDASPQKRQSVVIRQWIKTAMLDEPKVK